MNFIAYTVLLQAVFTVSVNSYSPYKHLYGQEPRSGDIVSPPSKIINPPRPKPIVEPPRPDPIVEPQGPDPIVEPPRPNPIVEPPGPDPIVEPPRPDPIVEPPRPGPIVEPPRLIVEPPPRPDPIEEPIRPDPIVEPPRPDPIVEPPRECGCEDKHSGCGLWAGHGLCSHSIQTVYNCPRSCGVCSGRGLDPTPDPIVETPTPVRPIPTRDPPIINPPSKGPPVPPVVPPDPQGCEDRYPKLCPMALTQLRNACERPDVRDDCPLTCGLCDDQGTDGGCDGLRYLYDCTETCDENHSSRNPCPVDTPLFSTYKECMDDKERTEPMGGKFINQGQILN